MNATFFCTQCGASLTPQDRFCNRCGTPIAAAPPVPVPAPVPPPAPINTQNPAATPPPVPVYPNVPAPAYAASAVGARYGGFWIRFLAAIIDAIIIEAVVIPVAFIGGGVMGVAGAASGMAREGVSILGGAIGFAVGVVASWLYEAFMESSRHQATLGKMIFGMKVTDLAGNRISFERASGRHFAKYLSGLILLIGYIMAGFSDRKQALHDMVAGTLVRRS